MKNDLGLPEHLLALTRARAPSESDSDSESGSSEERQATDSDDEEDGPIDDSRSNAATVDAAFLLDKAIDCILATLKLLPHELLTCAGVSRSWRHAGTTTPLWLQWCRDHGEWYARGLDRLRELHACKLGYLEHAERRREVRLCNHVRASLREPPDWPPPRALHAFTAHLQREARAAGGQHLVGESEEWPGLTLPPGLTAFLEVGLQVAEYLPDVRNSRWGMNIDVHSLRKCETYFCARGALAQIADAYAFGSYYLDGYYSILCIEWRPGKPPRLVAVTRENGAPLARPDRREYPFPECDWDEPDEVFGIFDAWDQVLTDGEARPMPTLYTVTVG